MVVIHKFLQGITTLNFGHKSMKEWNLRQIESIFHSMESVW